MKNLDELIREKQAKEYILYALREFNIQFKYINTNKLSQLLEESLDGDDIQLLHGAILELDSNQ